MGYRGTAKTVIAAAFAAFALAGCNATGTTLATNGPDGALTGDIAQINNAYLDSSSGYTVIADEAVALAGSIPALPAGFETSAPGNAAKTSGKATIDYSNATDGYVMVRYNQPSNKKLKALVKGPTTQYQYNLSPQTWAALPLSDGNGAYTIGVFENTQGTSYSTVVSTKLDVQLKDEFAPFLRSNQYVNITAAPNTIAKAEELCQGVSDPLEKVSKIYDFVINNVTYDDQKAATVQSGYLPVLDEVLASGRGICFDYAALMTGMLRSQDVPCKLVVGYAGSAYHAWIDVYTQGQGWISGAVWFDGSSWKRMDPTFASSANSSDAIMQYIGDGQNYSAKYFY